MKIGLVENCSFPPTNIRQPDSSEQSNASVHSFDFYLVSITCLWSNKEHGIALEGLGAFYAPRGVLGFSWIALRRVTYPQSSTGGGGYLR